MKDIPIYLAECIADLVIRLKQEEDTTEFFPIPLSSKDSRVSRKYEGAK